MRRWLKPTWPAEPSTISSASRCRRCCGASCQARARPAACSRWRCAWSCDREAEIEAFKSEEYWTIEALLLTAKAEDVRARLTAIAGQQAQIAWTSRMRPAPPPSRPPSRRALPPSPRWKKVGAPQSLCRRLRPRPCSRRHRASSASQRSKPCKWRSDFTRASSIGGETTGLITYMRTDGGVMHSGGRSRPFRRLVEQDYLGPLPSALHPRIQGQSQECPGGARGHSPDRRATPARWRCAASGSRPGTPLRAHLEAGGEPANGVRPSSNRRQPKSTLLAATARPTGSGATGSVVLFRGLSQTLRGRPRRPRSHGKPRAGGGRCTAARSAAAGSGRHRQATRHRGQSSTLPGPAALHGSNALVKRAGESSASAGPPPTLRRWPCCRSATMSASTRSA